MSFNWSASISPSFTGVKTAPTSSFADALKRLAEHVEEKNRNNPSYTTVPNFTAASFDLSTRMSSSQASNPMTPEQALRLYTQYIQELERREDLRRNPVRPFGSADNANGSPTMPNRRPDGPDPFRFMAAHLPGSFHPSTYFQSLAQPPRLPMLQSCSLPNTLAAETAPRAPAADHADERSEPPLQPCKPKSKLFRPYDLDSPHSDIQRVSPTSSVPKPSAAADQSHASASSGKEKQLFNSLGLAQQSADALPDKSSFAETSPSVSTSDETSSIETTPTPQDSQSDRSPSAGKEPPPPPSSSSSAVLKRKSTFSSHTKQSSHRKQSKSDNKRSHN